MSFKVAISDVLVCNEALALIPAEPITLMAEQSMEARECRRWYKPVVAELLEKHHWGLATKRVALAAVANDRRDEWPYAYAKPADMAFPVKMIPVGGGNPYQGWIARDGGYWSVTGRQLFLQIGGTIYSTIAAGVLEYTSFSITEADFTNLFKRIVSLELAARLCPPIAKNASRTQVLTVQAEAERVRVIANDLNRSQPTYGNRPTESELARFGIVDAPFFGGGGDVPGTAFDPSADNVGSVVTPDDAAPGDFYYEG